MNNKSIDKIAVFSHDLGQGRGGGAQRSLAIIASEFAKRGLNVDFILAQAKGRYFNEISNNVHIVDLNASRFLTSIPNLVQYLRTNKPNVLLSTLLHVDFAAILARYVAKVNTRVVTRLANTISIDIRSENNRLIKSISTLSPYFYPHADQIISVSNGVAEDFSNFTNISIDKIQTIYNPVITPQLLSSAEEELKHPWFSNDQPPVILAVGRLAPQKDYPTLIQAFSIVRSYIPSRLVILGDGNERSYIENLVNRLNLTNEVYMPGFIDNPFPFMSKANVYVLSSAWEGLPGTLIQALACGCPVVSTDCPSGPAEILDKGKYGYLTPVGDYQVLAQAIMKVLSGETKRIETKWLDRFRVETVINQYLTAIGYGI